MGRYTFSRNGAKAVVQLYTKQTKAYLDLNLMSIKKLTITK